MQTAVSFPWQVWSSVFLLSSALSLAGPPVSAPPATTTAAPPSAIADVDLGTAAAPYAAEQRWVERTAPLRVDTATAIAAWDAARQFYMKQQRSDGSFAPGLDLIKRKTADIDDPVRQAVALWGLAELCGARPTPEAQQALVRGFNCHFAASQSQAIGGTAPLHAGAVDIQTGAVACLALALMEFLEHQKSFMTADGRRVYEDWLRRYLDWLGRMQMGEGSWALRYIPMANEREATADPFCDSVCLLAYARAARVPGLADYAPRAAAAADHLARRYLLSVWNSGAEPAPLRAFAPVGAEALAELAGAGGPHADAFGDLALGLGWWVLLEPAALRDRDPAKSAVVVLSAAEVARKRQLAPALDHLRAAAMGLVARSLRLQVNGPYRATANPAQRWQPPPSAAGGFLVGEEVAMIRLDGARAPVRALLAASALGFLAP